MITPANEPTTPESMNTTRTPIRRTVTLVGKLAAGLGITATLSSCAQNAPQDSWSPDGKYSQYIQNLQLPVFITAGVVGLLVMILVTVTIARFRDRGQPIPEQTHGNQILEYVFIAIPALILVTIAVPTVSTVIKLADTSDPDCVINVTGQQWWWEYDYPIAPDGTICGFAPTQEAAPIITSGQMVIPTDAKVVIRGTSRDVIHSFWVPRLNGKRDMVPGRVHTWNFHANQPGIYSGQCAEFCGLSHAVMRMQIVALYPDDFQKWLDGQLTPYEAPAEGTPEAVGEAGFISQCARCHQVGGITDANGDPVISSPQVSVYSGAAPDLTKLMTRNTFAGASFELLTPECRERVYSAEPDEFGALYLEGVTPECLNEVELREWLTNAPAKKPMYTDGTLLEPTDGKSRGMPNLGLSPDQVTEILTYLQTLK